MKKLRLWNFLTSIQKSRLILLCGLFLFSSILEIVSVAGIYPYLNFLLNQEDYHLQLPYEIFSLFFTLKTREEYLVLYTVFLLGIYLIKGCMLMVCTWYQAKTNSDMHANIAQNMFNCIINESFLTLKKKNSAEIQRSLTEDIHYTFDATMAWMTLLQQVITGLSYLVVILYLNAGLAFGVVAILGTMLIVFQKITGRAASNAGQNARGEYIGMLNTVKESLGMLKQVRASNSQNTFSKIFNQHSNRYEHEARKAVILRNIPKVLFEALIICAVLIYLLILVLNGQDLQVLLPIFATFALATVKLIPVVTAMANSSTMIHYCQASEQRVCEALFEFNYLKNKNIQFQEIEKIPTGLKKVIEIRNISFRYDDGDELLKEISFNIPANSITALVGKTGAGKTTLADVLLGLYPVQAGTICADGKNIAEYREWWASCVGYMTQMVTLQDASIRDNILFGYAKDEIDDEQIWSCLKSVCLEEFVHSLPEGLDTQIGENGARLSGGQIQRLGIARALYSNPSFLVMDESTSALDAETEHAILETLVKLKEDHTILLITHRTSTLDICDYIYEVCDGKVECIKGE